MTEHIPDERLDGPRDVAPAEPSAQPHGPTDPTTAPASSSPTTAPPTTKTGVAFSALIAGAIVLILLLVFILENTESVKISFFGAGGHLPLGVALLLAAIGGALLVGIVGTARIVQLRRHLRRRRRAQ
jgi:uncharacterized integral membrane protein